tara:strand:- start:594 stop:902 length:309 start_codon:yes stop_codon:yes gene_type:complete
MTPEEQEHLDYKRKEKIEKLRQWKDTDGYAILCELIRDQFAACVTMKLNPNEYPDQTQIDADMRAWNSIGSLIDFEIASYDNYIAQVLEQQKRMQQGGYNAQ